MSGSTLVGAIQPEEEEAAVPLSASWRYTSRLTGSTGLASIGRAKRKRATVLPRHLVRGGGAVGDSK